MGRVYELMDEREARTVLTKLQRVWDAEKALKHAIEVHDGSDRSYRNLDRAVAAFSQARFSWRLTADDSPDQEQE